MEIIAAFGDVVIASRQDVSIEPGHRVLCISATDAGIALASLLTGCFDLPISNGMVEISHDAVVDRQLVRLADMLIHVRMSAPEIAQLTLAL